MIKNLKKKIIFLIIIGIALYFVIPFFVKIPQPDYGEFKGDKISPSTAVKSPEDRSWHNGSFEAIILDSDLGSGLVGYLPHEKGCKYIIEDMGAGKVSGGFRECGSAKIDVLIGEEGACFSSYQSDSSEGRCKISSKAFDKAGNDSGWRSNIYNIDLIKPIIGKITSPSTLELDETFHFQSSVSDNSKITGCWFYVDGKPVDTLVKTDPIPCKYNNQCAISLDYSFDIKGSHSLNFACKDIAGNSGFGDPVEIGVSMSRPPEISSCRVIPSQGNISTEFQFEVEVNDSDDELSYSWDFGDEKSSNDKNPIHYYENLGTYEPRVVVSDGKEEKGCSTAWVTIINN